ncbi:cellulose biosynthesis protein CelD [Psychromonas sp. CNPT3]|uniref:GNAT family N-acetyltransferase n=1 Tax=Psychromonas sp. CNPT3 TaxID=314282 RepID=UPI00006E9CA6|nr:GNAT family N-acetyltransferase [Psychromonas sp. CNPT3]AGH80211.1 cellulose biosynthesis protein CelD [Psychromonas sp. CNPT3]
MYRVRVIDNWNDFDTLRSDWTKLLQQSDANSIFLSWEWISCWSLSQRKNIKLCIILLLEDDDIVAIAPFYCCSYRFLHVIKYKALCCLGDTHSGAEYADFIVLKSRRADLKKALWQSLLSTEIKGRWDVIWLSNIGSWKTSAKCLLSSFHQVSALKSQQREIDFSSITLVNEEVSLVEIGSKRLLKNIGQTKRKLQRLGDWQIGYCQSKEDVAPLLQQFFHLHQQHWQYKNLQGSFQRSPALLSFYQAFIPLAFSKGWLRLAYLESLCEIKAMQLGYVYEGTFFALQEGYDPYFLGGCGQVLRHGVIHKCLAEKLHTYDFLGGYSDHKARWSATQKIGTQLFVFQNKIKNLPLYLFKIWPTGAYFKAAKK